MHTLPAIEIKRRGVAALEEALKKGPVHIIKHNRAVCVVLREEEYATLSQEKYTNSSLWDLLDFRPWKGDHSKKQIKQRLEEERKNWNE